MAPIPGRSSDGGPEEEELFSMEEVRGSKGPRRSWIASSAEPGPFFDNIEGISPNGGECHWMTWGFSGLLMRN
jgi:hypothetical protein